MVSKIAIIGPESSGKTTLSRQLAQHYQTVWVEEYARRYIDHLDRPYHQSDLREIARVQLQLEAEAIAKANCYLFCDTHLLVIKIWGDYKYGVSDPWIRDNMQLHSYAIHFLTDVDVPWEYDPQREHPHQRQVLWEIYRRELTEAKVNMVHLKGNQEERLAQAVKVIDAYAVVSCLP